MDNTKRTAGVDIVGHGRRGILMDHVMGALAKAGHAAPWFNDRAWVAESYEGWAQRTNTMAKPVNAKRVEHLMVELQKQGWLLRIRRGSPVHGDRTTLHVAPTDAFRTRFEEYRDLGRAAYFAKYSKAAMAKQRLDQKVKAHMAAKAAKPSPNSATVA